MEAQVPGEMAGELLGPALTVYNNEMFSEQDFQNITNTGDSGKRQVCVCACVCVCCVDGRACLCSAPVSFLVYKCVGGVLLS